MLDCYKVGNEVIFYLVRFCNSLEILIIGGCRDIIDKLIKSLVVFCNRILKKLRMDWCLSIIDFFLSCILINCRNLEVFGIGCCEEVIDVVFGRLGIGEDYVVNLKVLKVSNCLKIIVVGIGLVLDVCKFLGYFDVRLCLYIIKVGFGEVGIEIFEICNVNFNGSLIKLDGLL